MIGKELKLFTTSNHAKGSIFWLDRGTKLIQLLKNKILEILPKEYIVVNTPALYRSELFEKSGHLSNYRDSIFQVEDMYLKPMSCPAHILIYKEFHKGNNCKIFEFGSVFRKEATGALRCLTRCFNFTQDDAHIFTDKTSMKQEIQTLLEEIDTLYKYFKLDYNFIISTEDKFNKETDILKDILLERKASFELDLNGAAFYGPKIDIYVTSNGKSYQFGTIQLDFITLNKFEIKDKVLIHRALLGSIERFIGIYLEIYEGYFPFYIEDSPLFVLGSIEAPKLDKKVTVYKSLDNMKYYKSLKVPVIYIYGPKDVEKQQITTETYCPIQGVYINGKIDL